MDYKTRGTCSTMIHFDLDENKCVHNLSFEGGCNGNLGGISKLVEGMPAQKVKSLIPSRGQDAVSRRHPARTSWRRH